MKAGGAIRWLLTLVVMVGVGCGGGDGESSSSGDGGVACTTCGPYGDVLSAFCGVIDRCKDSVYPIAYRNRAECAAILGWATTCRFDSDSVNGVRIYSLEQTVPVVTPAAAAACVAWLGKATCEQVASMNEDRPATDAPDGGVPAPSPCQGVFSIPDDDDDDDDGTPAEPPPAGLGEPCRYGNSMACQPGLYCTAPTFTPATSTESCSVCAALPTLGQPCGNSALCAAGLYCKATTVAGNPMPVRTCATPEADGTVCVNDFECMSGFCKRPSGGAPSSVCDSGGTTGAPCAVSRDCRYPRVCVAGACMEPRPHGAPCTAAEQCQSRVCDMASGACGLPDGASCRSPTECRSSYCHDQTRTCATRKAVGQACTTSSECVSNECRNRVCFERCSSDRPCPAGQFCSWDTQQCQPLGAEGASCDDDDECLSGWCSPSERCAKKPKIGDACTSSAACYPLGYCANGRCTMRLGPGASCSVLDSCQEPFVCRRGRCELINLTCAPARTGEMCAYFRVCDASSYCDLADAFTCKPRKGAGAECSSTEECSAELYCQSDPQTGTRVCGPRLPAGSTCQGDDCAPGLYCIGSRTSRTCTPGPAGQPCSSEAPCPTGFHCNQDDVCAPPVAMGGDCLRDSNVPCAAGLYCDFSRGCQPKKALGDECSSNAPCAETLRCTGSPGTCKPLAKAGEPCSSSSSSSSSNATRECEVGLFCEYDQTIKATVCQAPKALGEPCNANDRCTSGACGQSGRCVTANMCPMR